MVENSLSEENIIEVLDWIYDSVLKGVPKLGSVYELADSYISKNETPDKAIKSLIRMQQGKAGTSGFLTGIGGLITLPIAVPVNISSVLYVQIRMIAAIAHIRGYDLKDDHVQTFVYACLTGQSGIEVAKRAGIEIVKKAGLAQLKRMPADILVKINQKIGFRLLTKFGEKGVINLWKMVPLLGGAVGATFDVASTYAIGKAADKMFIEFDENESVIVDVQ